jgi:glycosyltransferase involved in cell wall biosynthesis
MRKVVAGEGVGEVVPADPTAEQVAAAVARMCDGAEREALRARALNAARQRHNWGLESAKLLAVYEELLGSRRGERKGQV